MFKRTTHQSSSPCSCEDNRKCGDDIRNVCMDQLSDLRAQVGRFHGNQDDTSVEHPTQTYCSWRCRTRACVEDQDGWNIHSVSSMLDCSEKSDESGPGLPEVQERVSPWPD